MSKSYGLMSKTELELELKRLKENLEDLEELFNFNFTNTSAHISGKVVAKDEEELEKLKREIAKIEKLLSK
jgi:cell shape-determining protein MreC